MSFESEDIGKNIWYTSLSTIIPALITFVFWFITAKLVGPEAIGTATMLASLTMILSTIALLDTNLGMKRYLGMAHAKGDISLFKKVFMCTIIFVTLTLSILLIILFSNVQLLNLIGIEKEYYWAIALLVPTLSFQSIFAEALISSFRAKLLIFPQLIGSVARFPILFIFIYFLQSPIQGTILAYSIFFVTCAIFYCLNLRWFLKNSRVDLGGFITTLRNIVTTGFSSWIPHMISILGSQLSIISIFAIEGSEEAGKFYLPLAIFTITLFIVSGITRVSHPLIAGMDSENAQKTFVGKTIKWAYIFTIPLSTPLLFFPDYFLGIMGSEYSSAGGTLTVFMIGLPLSIITEIFYYYEYALGRKKSLLKLGLVGNILRVILYILLVPIMGQIGASVAYLIGSTVQLSYSLILARRYSFDLANKDYFILTIIPYLVGFIVWLVNAHVILSSIIIIVVPFILYIKFHFISDHESNKIMSVLLPSKIAKKIAPLVSKIIKTLR